MSLDLIDRARDESTDNDWTPSERVRDLAAALERAYEALAWCWYMAAALVYSVDGISSAKNGAISRLLTDRVFRAFNEDTEALTGALKRYPEGQVLLGEKEKVTTEEVLQLAEEVRPKDEEQARILAKLKATLSREG